MPHSAKKKWYEHAFDAAYLDRYAHRDEAEAARSVRLLCNLPLTPGAPAFDLCCGAGRHLPFLAQLGLNIIGGDLSLPLLREASAPNSRIVRLDMRALPFAPSSFQLVTNFFTAFGYFESDEENSRVVAEVARILQPGGWFLLDFLNAHLVGKKLACNTEWQTEARPNGTVARIHRHLTPDGRRAEKQVEEPSGTTYHESVRLYSCQELEQLLVAQGMSIVQRWGDYSANPFSIHHSPRCIVVGQTPS
ncbi:class I SAM-dependent methyltransferase [Candidatus Sumerlaeota bacterium]|nr:class I SAM-dependent methyltransferase [Candidatus Sumerlaeota bacterium]